MFNHHSLSGAARARMLSLAASAVLTAGLLAPAGAIQAEEITVHYDFAQPEIAQVLIAGQLYDRVTMTDCPNGGMTGQPYLPACGAKILLPPGADVLNVEVIAEETMSLGEGYFVDPVAEPVPLSQMQEKARPPMPDPAIYQLHTPFPDATFEEVGIQSFRGYRMLTLKLQPVSYVPASGELSWHPQLKVVVNTTRAAGISEMFRGLDADEQAAMAKVDNPEMIASYPQGAATDKGFDMLIITTPDFAASFEPLRDHHNANGIITEIHTTDDVGSTDPIQVRDYIIDHYLNEGIEYVIIGADDDIIPCKDLYVDGESAMPGDIYLSCLDGSWNWDGDSRWGEPNDGENGGDVDMVAEVYVGRACGGNTTEIDRFVNKTLWYLNGGHSTPENVLLVGEYLGFGGIAEWGGNYLDELVDGSSEHGYTTVGFPSDIMNVDTLYERDGSWDKWDLIDKLDNGLHILNHLGHGNNDYAMHLYNSDILSDVHNTDLCFVYSQTCLAGHLDNYDCWAETMNIKIDEGAYAVVMNARYGYGKFNSTDGPSQRYDREFWDAVYSDAEGLPEIGKANSDSKEDNIYRINEDYMRWCCYELNLFGDPSVAFREMSGMGVSPGQGFHSEGPNGGPFTPDEFTYTLINHDDTPIDFEVSKSAAWVDLSTYGGTIPAEGEATVTVYINDLPNNFPNGDYEDTISFVNLTNHEGDATRDVLLRVGVPVPLMLWDMSTDPGWTTESQWAYGTPTGNGGEYGNPDPDSGYTGSNVYGYNLNGDYSNSMPEYHLTTTAIDCSNLTQVHLKFWRWLGVETPSYDHAYVRVSNDGVNWDDAWQNTDYVEDSSWSQQAYDISSVADGQETVYIRWTMGTTDGSWRYCGWNIDDVEIWAVEPSAPCPWDTNDTGTVDIDDVFEILANWGQAGGPCDVNSDGTVDIDDVFDVLANWGPCP